MDFIKIFKEKFLIEREKILNEYNAMNVGEGEYFYVYARSSMMEDGFNLCSCKEGKSHEVILLPTNKLPEITRVGSIIIKTPYGLMYDENGTNEVQNKIEILTERLLDEQSEYLREKRIENHIYEMYEKSNDRIWLFDITNNEYNEEIEEIDFPLELLEKANPGDRFVYKNNTYFEYGS